MKVVNFILSRAASQIDKRNQRFLDYVLLDNSGEFLNRVTPFKRNQRFLVPTLVLGNKST